MIKKIQVLKNIGKFRSFTSRGQGLDWNKNTIVFGLNGYGKTTIVSILRSMRDNDPNGILARKALDTGDDPQAVIMTDAATHSFKDGGWNSYPPPEIVFFDAQYVRENIFTQEIEKAHTENIYRIIMGAEGTRLAKEVADLKDNLKGKRQDVKALADTFESDKFVIPLDEFLAISPKQAVDADPLTKKLAKDIKAKEDETVVRRLKYPRRAETPSYDLSKAKALADAKLYVSHKAAEKQVLDHIDRNFKDKKAARRFIRQGLDLKQKNCPFCGQDLSNAAVLLKAYQEFFDRAYRDHQQDLNDCVADLKKWNLDNDMTALASRHHENLGLVNQWVPYLGKSPMPDLATTALQHEDALSALMGKVLSELEKKQKDLDAAVDLSPFDELSTGLGALRTAVEEYNTAVSAFCAKGKQFSEDIPDLDVDTIQEELEKQESIQKRYEPRWKKWAEDYNAAQDEVNALSNDREEKQDELKQYSDTIFKEFAVHINQNLAEMGAEFEITEIEGKTDNRAKESYSHFGFIIMKKRVPLKLRGGIIDKPCFQNTLSEGDKSALAFAFFMAELESKPASELSNLIVVFDDPLSSLDENRRFQTVDLLRKLSPKVHQLNVFTHSKDILYWLCDKLSVKVTNTLQILSDNANGSFLEFFDVAEDRKSAHMRNINNMERYVDQNFGTPQDMQGNIRNAFEVVLKTKYYRTLADDIKQNAGLGSLLKKLFKAAKLPAQMKTELFPVCGVADGPHHGDIVDAPPRTLTRPEVVLLIKKTLDLLEKV